MISDDKNQKFSARPLLVLIATLNLIIACAGNGSVDVSKNLAPPEIITAVSEEKVTHDWDKQVIVSIKDQDYSLAGLRNFLSKTLPDEKFEVIDQQNNQTSNNSVETKVIRCEKAIVCDIVSKVLQLSPRVYSVRDQEVSIHGDPYILLAEPLYAMQWAVDTTHLREAWDQLPNQKEPIAVAVIDSGIDFSHKEFEGHIGMGYDFVENDDYPQDTNGHGTHISGIIAAQLNGFGIAGVAPNVIIMPLKIMAKDGRGNLSNLLKAFQYAIDHDVKIINISAGFYASGQDQTIYEALINEYTALAKSKGIAVIAAMGNRPLADGEKVFPAMNADVISVGAHDKRQNIINKFGDAGIIYAPGESILSTQCHFLHANGYLIPCPDVKTQLATDDFGYISGTSASTAFVSGAMALLVTQKENIAPSAAADYLRQFGYRGTLRINTSLIALKQDIARSKLIDEVPIANLTDNALPPIDSSLLKDPFVEPFASVALAPILSYIQIQAYPAKTFEPAFRLLQQATLGTGETKLVQDTLVGITAAHPGDIRFYYSGTDFIVETNPGICTDTYVCWIDFGFAASGFYSNVLADSRTREYLIAEIKAALDNGDFALALAQTLENSRALTNQNLIDLGAALAKASGRANGISEKNSRVRNLQLYIIALVDAVLDKDYPNLIGAEREALRQSKIEAALFEAALREGNPEICGDCEGNPVRTSNGLKEVMASDLRIPYGDFGIEVKRKHSLLYKNNHSLGRGWFLNLDTRIVVGVKKNADALLAQATALLNHATAALQEVRDAEADADQKITEMNQIAIDAENDLAGIVQDFATAAGLRDGIKSTYDANDTEVYAGIAAQRTIADGHLAASGAPDIEKQPVIDKFTSANARTAAALAGILANWNQAKNQYNATNASIDQTALAAKVQEIHAFINNALSKRGQLTSLHNQLQGIIDEMNIEVAQLAFDANLAHANAARNKEVLDPSNPEDQNFGNGYLKWVDETGTDRFFILNGDGTTTPYDQTRNLSQKKISLTQNADLSYTVKALDGAIYEFGSDGLIRSKTDRNGNRITYHYDIQEITGHLNDPNADNSRFVLSYIEDNNARKLQFVYDGRHLTQILDSLGRTIKYEYDSELLVKVIDQASQITRYQYDGSAISKIIDRNAIERSYEYASIDNLQRVIREIDPLGNAWLFQYDFANHTTDVTNRRGFTTRYISNARGSTIAKIYSDGTSETSEYDDRQNLTKRTDANGTSTSFEYNSDNLPIKVTFADGSIKYLSYDLNGKVTQVTDATGAVTRIFRDAKGNATEIQTPTATLRQIYDAKGLLLQTTDGNGRITAYTYDPFGYLKTMRNPEGGMTYFEFDQVGRMLSKREHDGATQYISYDVLDRPVKVINALAETTYLTYLPEGQLKQKVEPGSRVTVYNYDAANQLTSVIEPEGVTTNLSYDESGNVRARIRNGSLSTTIVYDSKDRPLFSNTDSRITRMTYDAVGNVLSSTNPLNQTTTFSYDNRYRLMVKTDPLSGRTRYEYDAESRVTATIDALNNRTVFTRDAIGRVSMVTDPMGGRMSVTYDASGNITRYRNQRGASLDISYNGLNQPVLKTDALGYRTRYQYDPQGRLRVLTKPDSSITAFDYDRLSRLIKTTNAEGEIESMAYDEQGNVTQMTDPTGSKWNFNFDKRNRLVRMQNPLGFASTIEYDKFDRRTAMVNAENERTEYTYDKVGNLTSILAPGSFETTFRYDKLGQPTDKFDALGRQTQYRYDALMRLSEVVDAQGGVTRYGYDALGNLKRTTDGNNNSTDYFYDANRRLIEERNALNQSTFFNYDAAGNLVRKTNADYTSIDYRYDLNNRPTERQYSDGRVDTFIFDSVNNLITQKNPDSEENYEYDRVQRLVRVTNLTLAKTFEYGYDLAGRITRITNPRGAGANQYAYDPAGRLVQSIAAESDGRPNLFAYDRVGRLRQRELANGAVANYNYDASGRLTRLAEQAGATTLVDMQFQYDPAGNITNLTRDGGRYETMTYDNNDRLQSYARNGRRVDYTYDAVGNRTREFGNITTGTGDISNTYNALNQLIRRDSLTEGATQFEYDARGNRILQNDVGSRTEFTYSLENQLTKIKQASGDEYSYRYDAVGRRVYKAFKKFQPSLPNGGVGINDPPVDATHMLYDRRQVLYDMTDAKAAKALYHYTPQSDMPYGNLISMKSYDTVNTSIDTLYYHTDHLGTTQKMTDRTGAVRVNYDHDAWGNVLTHAGDERQLTDAANQPYNVEPINRYTYTSKEHEFGTKLTAMDARVYQPQTAQWLQKDPNGVDLRFYPKQLPGLINAIRKRLHNPKVNAYIFVGQNPHVRIDITGFEDAAVQSRIDVISIIYANYDGPDGKGVQGEVTYGVVDAEGTSTYYSATSIWRGTEPYGERPTSRTHGRYFPIQIIRDRDPYSASAAGCGAPYRIKVLGDEEQIFFHACQGSEGCFVVGTGQAAEEFLNLIEEVSEGENFLGVTHRVIDMRSADEQAIRPGRDIDEAEAIYKEQQQNGIYPAIQPFP